jgi:hypothetical protein
MCRYVTPFSAALDLSENIQENHPLLLIFFQHPHSCNTTLPSHPLALASAKHLNLQLLSICLSVSHSLFLAHVDCPNKQRLTSRNQNIASNSIHPLRAQLHNNLQQLPRHLAILLLQRLPSLGRQQPSNAVQFRHNATSPLRAAEERQLAARRARHNTLMVVALLEVVLGAQDARLQQVEAVGRVAARVQFLATREDAAGEVGHDAEPEVFGAVGEVLEGLEEEGEGLLEVAPFGGGRGRGFGDCCCRRAVQELAAGGADHLVEGGD